MSVESTSAEIYTKFEPFRATEIWNEVLNEFRQKVPQMQRFKKNSDENSAANCCFTGSSAVKTLENYLTENRQKLGMKEITKEKVVKLCQILINEQIIESASSTHGSGEDQNGKKFLPNEISLYRFCPKKHTESSQNFIFEQNCVQMSPYRKPSTEVQRMWLTPNSCRAVGNRSPASANWRSFLQTPISNAFKVNSDISDAQRPYKSGTVSVNSEIVPSDDMELDGFDENVIYDLALFRLLTLVEIPVLDGILQFKGRREHSSKGASLENLFASLGLSSSSGRKKSHCLDDQSEISKLSDPWLIYGCTYLNEMSSMNFHELKSIESNHEKRIYVYRKMVDTTKKFYKDEPFFPSHYDEVLKEIFDLLLKKRFTLALEACQYFILLLPNEQRRRFHYLLKFLYYCSMNKETRLSTELSNSQMVLQNLRESIVKCHSLSKTNILQFLDFIIGNCRQVLKPPEGFQGQLFQRQFRQMYTVAEPDPGISYCQRITPAQFEQQKGEASESALVHLVSSVVDDLTMSLPQKIEWLDKFKLEYPELYSRRFSTLRW